MADKHLTNLESEEHVLTLLDEAQKAVDAADPVDKPRAEAKLAHARAVAEGQRNTMAFIRQEHGEVTIGDPKPTKWRTVAQLKATGHIGVYRA